VVEGADVAVLIEIAVVKPANSVLRHLLLIMAVYLIEVDFQGDHLYDHLLIHQGLYQILIPLEYDPLLNIFDYQEKQLTLNHYFLCS